MLQNYIVSTLVWVIVNFILLMLGGGILGINLRGSESLRYSSDFFPFGRFFRLSAYDYSEFLIYTVVPFFLYYSYWLWTKDRTKQEPITYYDKMNSIIVKAWRSFAKENGTAPTSKTSDEKIIEIYSKVFNEFKKASETRGEVITVDVSNLIAYHILAVYEKSGEDYMNEHLEYEIDLYKKSGLREDYKKGLKLF